MLGIISSMSDQQFPAKTLASISRAVVPQPLVTREELAQLYRAEVNAVRGQDLVRRMKLELEDSFFSTFYKAFLIGHSGVGKSTEMSRLVLELEAQYVPVRLSAKQDLDPGSFEPFDVVLVMIMQLIEQARMPESQGGIAFSPPDNVLRPLLDWLADKVERYDSSREMSAEANAGAGGEQSLLAKAIGLFAGVKGEIRYAAARRKEQVEHQLRRLSDLLRIANNILAIYRAALKKHSNREWLFIGEDFDKAGAAVDVTEKLFLTYGNLFRELECHLIFSIPIALVYSQAGSQLPFNNNRILCIPDTPVFDKEHKPHSAGRAAVRAVLSARVDPSLFGPDQMERLIVDSGGNLRDLFSMVNHASLNARLRGSDTIDASDVAAAVNEMRITYQRRLGVSPYDPEEITFEKKAERLEAIYFRDPDADVPDPVLHSLLNARAVQEFNGERWFGVHPLVVELLLRRPGRLQERAESKPKPRTKKAS